MIFKIDALFEIGDAHTFQHTFSHKLVLDFSKTTTDVCFFLFLKSHV